MSPSHEAGPGPLPAPADSLVAPTRPGARAVPSPSPGADITVRRVLRTTPEHAFSGLTDPWSLIVLHGAGEVLGLDDAPWRLGPGDRVGYDVRRWGSELRAILTVDAVVPGSGLTWRVDYCRDGRVVHAGERWTVRLERHPRGVWVDLSVENTSLRGLPFRRRHRTLELRQAMTRRLREFDVLLTRYDRPAVTD